MKGGVGGSRSESFEIRCAMTSFKGGYLKTVGKGWGEVRYKVSVDTVVLDLKHYLPTWAPMGLQRKAKDNAQFLANIKMLS